MTDRALDDLARRVMLDAARLEYGGLMDQLPEHDFSPEFERRMKKLIRRADHPGRWRRMWAGRIAATLALLLALATAAAAAAGYSLWELLAQWTDEQIWIAPGQIDPVDQGAIHIPAEPKVYADIQEALDAYGVDLPLVPRRLPDGFVPEEVIVDHTTFPDQIVFYEACRRGKDFLVVQINVFLEQEDMEQEHFGHFQKDEGDPVPYEVGGITHLLSTNAGQPIALWANGPAECAVSGDITMEELKAILNSIYGEPLD